MLELALKGNKSYWTWIVALLAVIGAGVTIYLWQLKMGLMITGMSRDVSWGFYIANFTYMVGVAAGGVMVVLPYYLHDYKAYGRITIMGEFLAIASIVVCVLLVFVDLGQPMRLTNLMVYPSPNSILFYDIIVLNVYLLLNLVVGWNALEAERNGVHYQNWLKPLIFRKTRSRDRQSSVRTNQRPFNRVAEWYTQKKEVEGDAGSMEWILRVSRTDGQRWSNGGGCQTPQNRPANVY